MGTAVHLVEPIEIDRFTCIGQGLIYQGHSRESPFNLRKLILPSDDRNGISDRDRLKSWWQAQCIFYGVPESKSFTIKKLRANLEEALRAPTGMIVPEQILNLEDDANRAFNNKGMRSRWENQLPEGNPRVSSGSTRRVSASKPPSTVSTSAPSISSSTVSSAAPSRRTTRASVRNYSLEHLVTSAPPQSEYSSTQDTHSVDDGTSTVVEDNFPNFQSESQFSFLAGTYHITAQPILDNWEGQLETTAFTLVVRLGSHSRLIGEFELGVIHGALRSTLDISPRSDGASTKFEWCGKDADEFEGAILPAHTKSTGTLRFTQRKRSGKHLLKGTLLNFHDPSKLVFTGEKVSDRTTIRHGWEDYNEE